MQLIRHLIFETNSSSTHSLVIMSKQDYQDWKDHKKVLNICKELGTVEELSESDKEIIRLEDGKVQYKNDTFDSMEDFMESDYYDVIEDENASEEYVEEYAETIKTEINDKVILSIYRGERW